MKKYAGKTDYIPSPVNLFVKVLVIVFLSEAVVMLILPMLSVENIISVALIDAFTLTVLIGPFLWRFIVRPLYTTTQELQKANNAIKELNMTLEQRVQERTQELVDINAELIVEKERTEKALQDLKMAQVRLMQSAKMAAVGQLAGGIAHEINNPMGVILGFSQVIMKRVKEDDPLYKPLKSIERESMRCRKLVMNLLTFSRTGNQKKDKTDINTMIGEVLEIVGYQTKLRGIEIINSFGRDMPDILADKNQLQQVIMNLCTNAIDSMNNGRPGRLEIRTAKEEEDGYCGVQIEIEDNGSGISEEVRERIFEPFFTTKEVGQGTGLGLSICYEIIQRHNGSIYVESEKGKGSKFTIRLPENA